MVKNFSQMAYINSSGKGLELYPQVLKFLNVKFEQSEESEEERPEDGIGENFGD